MIDHFQPVDITPEEFERQVRNWLEASADGPIRFTIVRSSMLEGDSGEYEIDILAEFEIFDGALIKVLVECKRYKNPVKRDAIMILESKIRDSATHKGMVFSTSGFQKGALTYANKRGIATITVQHGHTNYFTRTAGGRPATPPPWVKLSEYIGWLITLTKNGDESHSLIDDDRNDPLHEWFHSPLST